MTVKWRWWRFRFELDTFGEWRWRQPLGWGPRWLRRVWCVAFHWPQYDRISDSSCKITSGTSIRSWLHLFMHQRTYGPGVQIYEHIRVLGCYQCQLPWSRRYRYDSHPDLEDHP